MPGKRLFNVIFINSPANNYYTSVQPNIIKANEKFYIKITIVHIEPNHNNIEKQVKNYVLSAFNTHTTTEHDNLMSLFTLFLFIFLRFQLTCNFAKILI